MISSTRHDQLETIEALLPSFALRNNQHIPAFGLDEYREALEGREIVKLGETDNTHDRYAVILKRVPFPIWQLWLGVIDRSHYNQLGREIRESIIVSKAATSFVMYLFAEMPFPISDRHQMLECHANENIFEASAGKVWEHYWNLSPQFSQWLEVLQEKKLHRNISQSKIAKAERIRRNDGAWCLISLPDGSTLVEMYMINDPGGAFPKRFADNFATVSIKKFAKEIEELLSQRFASHFDSTHELVLSPDQRWLQPLELDALG